mgnify:FL=1
MESNSTFNLFEMAQKQFDHCADLLSLDHHVREFLRLPMREYQFSLPIKLDNGDTKILRGFHVQFNDSRGPTKGGIRFHPLETLDTIRALGMWMTWKCAIANLPLGGGSSGVACDPHSLSPFEMERICRGFVRKIAHQSGPEWDVLGPDIMTGPQQMLWMLDEYETIVGHKSPGFVTGKPIHHAGSHGRKEAPGYGVMITVREALKDLGTSVDKTKASFQGFGLVGKHAAQLYSQMGGKILSVACWNQNDRTTYTYRKKDGADFEQLVSISDRFGEIDKQKALDLGYECLPGDAWISQDVDILVPAALENQIRPDNVNRISPQVKIIAEAANGPTDPVVDPELAKRGILIIPDILANSGGVICSYFEQVQSNMNYFWSKDEVLSKLDSLMTSAYMDMGNFAHKNQLTSRDAVYMLAIDRVARSCLDRGLI